VGGKTRPSGAGDPIPRQKCRRNAQTQKITGRRWAEEPANKNIGGRPRHTPKKVEAKTQAHKTTGGR